MGKIPEGREPLPDEWFNKWPNVDSLYDVEVDKTTPPKERKQDDRDQPH